MMTVETIGRIRREFFVQRKTIKEIARELRVSRNTVRKVVRSGATAFAYERETQPRPKLGAGWPLDGVCWRRTWRRRRARAADADPGVRGVARGGYAGGYDAVRRYATRWSTARGRASVAASSR